MRDFQLDDPKLEEELDKALAALAQARDQDKKPVTINFRGQGERRVRMGYVVETPVWKTSYRLILSDAAPGTADGARPRRQQTRPADPAPPHAARASSPARAASRAGPSSRTRPTTTGTTCSFRWSAAGPSATSRTSTTRCSSPGRSSSPTCT